MLEKIMAFFMAIINFFLSLFGFGAWGGQKYDCQEFLNIPYSTQERQIVDICLPKDATGDLGMILFIHGGAWTAGDKQSHGNDMRYSASYLSVASAALNYRYISETVSTHDILDDIDAALATVKAVAKQNGVNINKVLLTGSSAGAHLSLLYAYSRKDTAPIEPVAVVSNCGPTDLFDDNFYHNNTLGDSATVAQLMSYACGQSFKYEDKESAKQALYSASPVTYVNSGTVPTVINHGNADSVVPFSNALSLDALLTKYGVEHELNVYNGADHDLGRDDEAKKRADDLMLSYIDRFLK